MITLSQFIVVFPHVNYVYFSFEWCQPVGHFSAKGEIFFELNIDVAWKTFVSLKTLQDLMVQYRQFPLFGFEQALNIFHAESIPITKANMTLRYPGADTTRAGVKPAPMRRCLTCWVGARFILTRKEPTIVPVFLLETPILAFPLSRQSSTRVTTPCSLGAGSLWNWMNVGLIR